MDDYRVDMQLLSLTAPGVQMFDAGTATDLAASANDWPAEICAKRPSRFAGLASFAPQRPKRAAREMEHAVRSLKLNGFILNSHTTEEDLDDPKYWPVLEAAEALDAGCDRVFSDTHDLYRPHGRGNPVVITTSEVEDALALDYSIERVGVENVLWAIDYPYQPMKPAVEFMDAAPVNEAERHLLYHGNAERIFHIAPI